MESVSEGFQSDDASANTPAGLSCPRPNGYDAACFQQQREGPDTNSWGPSGACGPDGSRGAPTALRRAASMGSGGAERFNVLEDREIDHCESFAIPSAGASRGFYLVFGVFFSDVPLIE